MQDKTTERNSGLKGKMPAGIPHGLIRGGRQFTKKLTNKQYQERNAFLELQNATLKLDIRERTANMLTQMQVFEGIFMSAIESAATIGEARRWYKEWVEDINGLPIDDPDHKEKINAIVAKHGFEITISDNHQLVDDIWEREKLA
jgi:hypothetical protein